MSNINSKNSSDAIIESKLFKLSLVDLEKNGGIKIGSFGDRLYSEDWTPSLSGGTFGEDLKTGQIIYDFEDCLRFTRG